MSDPELSSNPHDIELRRRAIIFHEKLALLKAGIGTDKYRELAVSAAAASHFLWDAKVRSPTPDVWEAASSTFNLIRLAQGSEPEGGTIKISEGAAQEMISRSLEDPDDFEALKKICGYALMGEPMPDSGETTFELHALLSGWIGKVTSNETRKPKTRKRQPLASAIIKPAIANTVQFLKDAGLPVFKNEATCNSVNACDAVAKISGEALDRRKIKGDAVKKIYYKSEWGKLEKS